MHRTDVWQIPRAPRTPAPLLVQSARDEKALAVRELQRVPDEANALPKVNSELPPWQVHAGIGLTLASRDGLFFQGPAAWESSTCKIRAGQMRALRLSRPMVARRCAGGGARQVRGPLLSGALAHSANEWPRAGHPAAWRALGLHATAPRDPRQEARPAETWAARRRQPDARASHRAPSARGLSRPRFKVAPSR